MDDVEAHYAIDLKRVFFVGHSNGAFMSHRMGCDSAGKVAAIAAFAGDNWADPSKCNPSVPVAALQIHGDADTEVPYGGNPATDTPSAMASIGVWAMKNNCTGGLQDTGKTYDLAVDLAGAETSGAAWTCPVGAAELWTMHGGGHVPNLQVPEWGNEIFDWLMAHQKS
jgi:polyhydroxybutyrate depolymerase